jgi:DNA-binding CsgD family transcriptional regulator
MSGWTRTDVADEERALLQILDDFALAIFVTDPELRVLEQNAAARELLEQGRGLCMVRGTLRATTARDNDALARAIGQCVAFPSRSPSTHGASLETGCEPPLHVFVRALSGTASTARASRIAIYVVDRQQQASLDAELLRRVYGFSPAEIRVLNELMAGETVESIAAILSISVYTVRSHLKRLFGKTGTNRQGELIAQIAAALGGFRRTDGAAVPGCESTGEKPGNERVDRSE